MGSEMNIRDRASKVDYQGAYNAEEQAITEKENVRLIVAINRLPPICRQVFIQRKLYAKSHQQIADMLNISTKTVENHLSKGLLLCRKYMLEQVSGNHSEYIISPKQMNKVAR